jgi:hypothetical protein
MNNLAQYGVAVMVTFLLLKEVFAFVLKMRNGKTEVANCRYDSRVLGEIRDGIKELVILARQDG